MNVKILVAVAVVAAVAAASIVMLSGLGRRPPWDMGRMELDEQSLAEVTLAFEGSGNVTSYCSENHMNCMYYCLNIDPDNDLCDDIRNVTSRRWIR